ncbi:MAG: FAD-dependent monooxygenase [Pararhodobacter sp.]
MTPRSILIIGAGIGGLTAATALRRSGFDVEIVERSPDWGVYGVGISQQFNVLRALAGLDLLDTYMEQAIGLDRTTLFGPDGEQLVSFETPRLAGPDYPSNAGIRRSDLQKVLGTRALELGATLRLGLTVAELDDDGTLVHAVFSDGTRGTYDLVIGADGVHSQTRRMIMPEAPSPRYTGQWVWRYNLPKPATFDGIQIYHGPCNAGMVPLNRGMTYVFVLSQEEPGYRLAELGAADQMHRRATRAAPQILKAMEQVTEDSEVVARPLEVIFLDGDWHRGRIVLLGDAVHASTPHLAQGSAMAIEDAVVLAEELSRHSDPQTAFSAYRDRRYDRARFIYDNSVLIGDAQMRKAPPVDAGAISGKMMALMAQPI